MNSYVQVFMLVLLTTSGADTAVLVTLAVITTPALSIGWACTHHSGGGRERGREGRSREPCDTTVTRSLTSLACADAAVHTTVSRTLALCRVTAAVH